MNTLDLDTLTKFTEKARELQAIAADLKPFLELIRELDGKAILSMPADRLIHSGEAAKILGVNQNKISSLVKKGLLTPLFIDSNRRKFWLSEVLALPKKTTKAFKASSDGNIIKERQCQADCVSRES